jgi:hypothetical protein
MRATGGSANGCQKMFGRMKPARVSIPAPSSTRGRIFIFESVRDNPAAARSDLVRRATHDWFVMAGDFNCRQRIRDDTGAGSHCSRGGSKLAAPPGECENDGMCASGQIVRAWRMLSFREPPPRRPVKLHPAEQSS